MRFVGTAAPNLAPPARAARRLRNLEENTRLRWCGLSGRLRPASLRQPAQRDVSVIWKKTPDYGGAACRDGCAHLAPQARAARRLRNLEENARLRWYSLPGRRRPTSLRRPARRVRRGSAPDPGIDRREWTRRLAACDLRQGRRSYAKHDKVQRGLGCPQPQRLPPSLRTSHFARLAPDSCRTSATDPTPNTRIIIVDELMKPGL